MELYACLRGRNAGASAASREGDIMRWFDFAARCLALALLLGSLGTGGAALAQGTPAAPPPPAAAAANPVYKLGTGDKVRIIVFGETNLGGEYVVDGSGFIRLPLVGQLKAIGLTVGEFEQEMITLLKDGYLIDPRVSVEVTNYRPFYIMGEVNKPGEYPYVSDMSVLNAVALAGGYTYRANQSSVYIRRNGDATEQSMPADQNSKINPGDIIRVRERFF
jgi:protein involved in polysaccharide export with SLBB domain